MLDKKQIQAIFLFEFKTGHKAAERKQLATSSMHLAQELIMSVQCSVVARNFAKEMRALKMGNVGVGHQKLTRTYWEQLLKLILLEAHKRLPKNSSLTILWSFSIWSKLERWESSISGCLMIWRKIKKIIIFKCYLLLFYATTTNHFLIRLWCVMKSGFIQQSAMTSSMVGLRRSSKPFPKAKLAPKKGHGHCLVVCCPCDPLQLSESWWNHYVWEVCSANWWASLKTTTPAASIGQQKRAQFFTTPDDWMLHNQCFIEQIGLRSFASFTIFTWPLTNWLPLLQASQQFFEGKRLTQPTGGKKHFPRVHQIPKHRFFYATGINKIISHWQKCVDCNGSHFD